MPNLIADQLRPAVFECLKKDRPYGENPLSFDILFGDVARLAKARDLHLDNNIKAWQDNHHGGVELHPSLRLPVSDLVWDLVDKKPI